MIFIRFSDFIRFLTVAAGLGPVKEGRFLLPDNDRRPADVLVPNWTGSKDAAKDIKVTTPIKVTTMPGAANTAGFALDHARKGKLDGAEEAGLGFPAARGRDLWGLAPLCPEGGEEIGVCPRKAHWAGRGPGSLPPLGETGHLTPAGERGNSGEPCTNPARPADRRNHVNFTLLVHCL